MHDAEPGTAEHTVTGGHHTAAPLPPPPTRSTTVGAPAGLSTGQSQNYTRFAHSVNTRGLPEPVRAFLLALREHQLRAGLPGPALARRAAERQHARGETPGTGLVGHTRTGRFSAAVLSEELLGRSRLPRPELVAVVAGAYAQRTGQPPGRVLDRLEALRADAEIAAIDHEHQRRR